MPLLTTVPPFAASAPLSGSATPEKLPSPNGQVRRTRACRGVASPFRGTYRAGLSGRAGTAWDFHRSVSSAIVTRRHHQPPRMAARHNRHTVLRERACGSPDASARTGAWHPYAAESWHLPICPARPLRHRPLPDDAGSPSRGRWTGVLDRSGPAQVGLRPPHRKTAPFKTEPTTPAAHTARRASQARDTGGPCLRGGLPGTALGHR